ncbi:MAG: aldo/keto reductase [Geminicoccaceae bacterium]
MDMKERRRLGGSEVEVTTHGFGGVPLGNLYRKCSDEDARATLGAAWAAGIRFYDTAPLYGHGMSEHRIGHFMHQHPRATNGCSRPDRPGAQGQEPRPRHQHAQLRRLPPLRRRLRLHL